MPTTIRAQRRNQFIADLPALDYSQDSVASVVIHATQIVERTHETGKLAALTHAVVSAASGEYDDLVPLFMGWLDYFTIQHIEMLYVAANPPKSQGGFQTSVGLGYPQRSQSRLESDMDNVIWKDLYARRLVDCDYKRELHRDISHLGDAFLAFIGRA